MAEKDYNDRFDDISYEKGWRRASVPEKYVPPENIRDEPKDGKPRGKRSAQKPRIKGPFRFLLLTLQLTACAAALTAILAFKLFGGAKYEDFRELYFKQLNNSLFETPIENLLDLSEIFEALPSQGDGDKADGLPCESGSAEEASGSALPEFSDVTGNAF